MVVMKKELLKTLRNTFLVGLAVSTLGLTACPEPTGGTEPTKPVEPTKPEPPKPTEGYQIVKSVNDVYFTNPVAFDSQAEAAAHMMLKQTQLHEQTDTIKNAVAPDADFAAVIDDVQGNVYGIIDISSIVLWTRYTNIESQKIVDAMSAPELHGSQSDAETYKARLNAFVKANHINQREQNGSSYPADFYSAEKKTADYAELSTLIPAIGDVTLPAVGRPAKVDGQDVEVKSQAHALTIALEDILLRTAPEKAGEKGKMCIQQLEDLAQLDGWKFDIIDGGFVPDFHVMKNQTMVPQTREALAAEVGIVK